MSTEIDTDIDPTSPWHPGELAAQARAGASDKITPLGSKLIRDHMPDQHRQLFEQLPMLILGAEDNAGDLWASALFGEPGFIHSPTPTQLSINAALPPQDPLATSLKTGSHLGLLGIQLQTRRRNRANGIITAADGDTLSLGITQSFGNCAKYITRRQPEPNLNYGDFSHEQFSNWTDHAVKLIRSADTFFIATAFDDGELARNRGIDVSHRGGEPGFLQFDAQQRLLIPDFSGNNFFNTVGNLSMDQRVGLLFMDFEQGHTLHLTGTASVVWRDEAELPFDNVERMIRVTLKRGRLIRNTLPEVWPLMTGDG